MARSFNGSSNTIAISNSFQPTGTVSISAWIKFGTTANFTGAILSGGTNTYEFRWTGASATTGTLTLNKTFTLLIGNSNTQTVSTGVWYHVGVSYDGTTVRFYWNGVAVGSTATSTTIVASGTWNIGSAGDVSEFFNGTIADVAYWSSILTPTQFAGLASGARPSFVQSGFSNLVLWLPLDGLQSPEPDISGRAFNGTITGATATFGPPFMQLTPRWPQGVIASAAPTFNPAWAINRNRFVEGFAS